MIRALMAGMLSAALLWLIWAILYITKRERNNKELQFKKKPRR